MTPVTTPALFVHDPETGRYWPANKVATTLAAQFSRMTLTRGDLVAVKAKGYHVAHVNGEPIDTGVKA